MRRVRLLLSLLIFALCLPVAAAAQEMKTFVVLPFEVHGPDKYAYLGQGIQSMLVSRLSWREHFQPLDAGAAGDAVTAPASQKEALDVLKTLGADYLIYGSATIMGDDASLDVKVQGKDGQMWPRTSAGKISTLIPDLEKVAQDINGEIFKRPSARKEVQEKKKVQVLNSELVYNEADARQEFHLNPQFKYEGGDSSDGRWQSRTLPFAMHNAVFGDADGDGKSEIFILDADNGLHAYRLKGRDLDLLVEHKIGGRLIPLRMNLFDYDHDGRQEIIVSCITDDDSQEPWAIVLNWAGDKFVVRHERLALFLNVIAMPPYMEKVLIGQKRGKTNAFESSVHEVIPSSSGLELGKRISTPYNLTNLFNFAYFPTADGVVTVVSDQFEKLRVYEKDTQIFATGDEYLNSPVGVNLVRSYAGFGLQNEDDRWTDAYYIPSRFLIAQLGTGDTPELIAGKNISISAKFFDRFRNYPYGEMHSLKWDGVGLNLVWKTRRLKGTIVDYDLTDFDGDGQKELVVCMNTYPGSSGLSKRRAYFLAFELNMEQAQEEQ